ncbi:MAG: hypothetical protein AAF721_00335 [Myxococcota bacterium]
MTDLKEWARRTAPELTEAELNAALAFPGDQEMVIVARLSGRAFSPAQRSAITARVQELADGLSSDERAVLGYANDSPSVAGTGAARICRLGLLSVDKAKPFGEWCRIAPLGRAVLRAKGGAA